MSKYSVPFVIEGEIYIEIEDCWDREEAVEEVQSVLGDIRYGKLSDVNDLANSDDEIEDILDYDIEWDEDEGCGSGLHRITAALNLDVNASSFTEALKIAVNEFDNLRKNKDLSKEYFGDVQDISYETIPDIDKIIKIENENKSR